MKTNRSVAKVSTLTAAIMAVYGVPAFAEDDEVAQYVTPESTVSVGVGYQSKDRPQFGIFDGRQKDGTKLLIDADIKKRDDASGTWNEFRANNIGLDNPDLYLGHSRQGDYGVSVEYSRIPRESAYTVNTGLVGVGSQNQTVTTLAAPGLGNDLHLGTNRDRYTFSINKVLNESFEASIKFRQEEKDGLRHFGAYIANVPKFLVEPINSTTRQLDATLNYLSKDLQLQGGYYGSWYDNHNSFITATGPTYVGLPPDNQAHQLFLNGSYAFTQTTKGTMRIARSRATQNDQSMVNGLPAGQVWAGFGGVKAIRVNTEYQFGISSRATKDLSLVANIHYLDRKDNTPLMAYDSVVPADKTTPRSFTSLNTKFEAAYNMAKDFKLLGGVYVEKRQRSVATDSINVAPTAPSNAGANWTIPVNATNDREVPYRASNTEVTYKAQATKNFSDLLNGSLVLSHSKRDGSGYYWGTQQNLINPLHMANRDRDKAGIKLDLSPSEALSIQAQFEQAKDDYSTNGLNGDKTSGGATLYGTGIKDGSAQLFSLDATYQISDNWSFAAWYSRDDSKATQYAFQDAFGRDPIRKSHLRDTGDSFGFNLKGKASAKLTLGADLQWNRSVGQYNQDNVKDAGATLNETLPDVTNKALRLSLNGTYALDKASALRVDLIHDRWVTNDWTWQMWNNSSTALVPLVYNADGTSVTTQSKQVSNFLSVRYLYKFQ